MRNLFHGWQADDSVFILLHESRDLKKKYVSWVMIKKFGL